MLVSSYIMLNQFWKFTNSGSFLWNKLAYNNNAYLMHVLYTENIVYVVVKSPNSFYKVCSRNIYGKGVYDAKCVVTRSLSRTIEFCSSNDFNKKDPILFFN